MTEQKKKRSDALLVSENAVAGTLAGVVMMVFYPLDTVRTRLQATNRFRGTWHCFVDTVKSEGVFALWKGMSGPLLTEALHKSVIFGSNSGVQQFLRKSFNVPQQQQLPLGLVALSGVGSGTVSATMYCPVELVRNRLMLQSQRVTLFHQHSAVRAQHALFRGPLDCARRVVRAEGVLGLFRGWSAMLVRDVPGAAAWCVVFCVFLFSLRVFSMRVLFRWFSFEAMKRALTPANACDKPPTTATLAIGALSLHHCVSLCVSLSLSHSHTLCICSWCVFWCVILGRGNAVRFD